MIEGPFQIDETQPSIARVYDYVIGGKDNYAVDREVGDFFLQQIPGSEAIAIENRKALIRTVGELCRRGITQFIDIGSGLPTADNVHQVAQRHNPDARVVYIDNDAAVLAHGRALLVNDDQTAVCAGDLTDPASIFAEPEMARLIDFDQPVGLIFSAVLHHLNDDEKPGELVKACVDRIASGSLVYISHFLSGDNEETRIAEDKLQGSFGRGRWRNKEEILALFGDLEILEPGLVLCTNWYPDEPVTHELTIWEQLICSALARKP